MGCCENINNLFDKNKNLSKSFSLKEKNLSTNNKDYKFNIDNAYIKKLLKNNQTPKFDLNVYKRYKILDKINEEDSEYKESSVNTRIINNEKKSNKYKEREIKKIVKNNIGNKKLEKMKISRRNRSFSEFKTILSEDIFYKKLNEYKKNDKINYLNKVVSLNN